MRKLKIRILPVLPLASFVLMGCSSLMFWKSDDPPAAAQPAAAAAQPTAAHADDEAAATAAVPGKSGVADEHELKLAKLWARVDELEEEQFRQKERIRVLEKGLTLGLIPDELRQPPPEAKPRPRPAPPPPQAKAPPPKEPKATPPPGALSKEDSEKYQTGLANAHAFYRDGKYGRAIVAYSELAKEFGDKVDNGLPLYWIAKCWASLGEYESSRQQLIEFLKSHPTSPWVPRAKLELARAEWRLGEEESALALLKGIIEQYPYEDATEMAKMELESLGKKLDLHSPTDLPPSGSVNRKSQAKKMSDEKL